MFGVHDPSETTVSEGSVRILEWRDVHKRFGGVQALKGVTLAVSPGEVLAIVGENGAGKSTLVGIAAGRVSADGGELLVDGVEVAGHGPIASMRVGIRLVPQELLVCTDMTVLDNVLLGAWPKRMGILLDRASAMELVSQRLESLGAGIDPEALVATLSVVEQAFVQIARSFTADARVLLVDEPTAPMDADEVDRFLGVLKAITGAGMAVVYISHRLDEIFRLADRVAVLRDGRLVAELSKGAINQRAVIAAMTGDTAFSRPAPREGSGGDLLLSVRDLSAQGIDNVDLDVRAGEIVAVYGLAGSGRDCLGKAIVGATRRHGGVVRIRGASIKANSVVAAVQAGVGYVPAERRSEGLMLEASVADNLALALLWRLSHCGLLFRGAIRRLAELWIERMSIQVLDSDSRMDTLSGGSQQKVLLARWLAADSEVLILDEPTRGVDIATKAEIYRLLQDLADTGKGVLVVTPDVEEATLIGQRVLVMRHGRFATELVWPTQEELAHAAQGV